MLQTLKKVWRFLRKCKGIIIVSLLMLVLNQVLSFFSPLIVKEILDEHLIGVEYTWYPVTSADDKSVTFKGKTYKQERNFDEDDTIINYDEGVSVFMIDGKYYFIEEVLPDGSKELNGTTLTIRQNEVTYIYENVEELQHEDVLSFYSPSIEPLIILLVALLLRALLSIVFGYIQRILTEKVNVKIILAARLEAAKKITRLPMTYFEQEPAGKTSARITHDVSGLMELYRAIINIVLYAGLSFIFAYVGMFYLDWRLAIISFLIYPIIIIWIKYFSKTLNKIAIKVNEMSSLIVAHVNEIINGINILQIFNYKKQTISEFDELSQSYMDEQLKEVRLHTSLGWNMINLIRGIITALVVLYFGWNDLTVFDMTISAGLIIAYNEYLLKLIEPVGILFREVSGLEHSFVRCNRLFKILDGDLEDDSFEQIPAFKGKVDFDNIWFAYKKDQYILKGVSIDIPAGSMLGVVGHTGSGKSTLMNLLMRFNDLSQTDYGEIKVDDINITTYSKRTFRQHVGIVLQDPVLFKGTLADNIRFGKEGISDDDLVKTLISVGGQKILESSPLGINQEISRKGSNLSLGEKQIISFARALIHNPPILIMDEATASIDTETETMIQNALKVVSKDRTTIVIAHRLSTIRNADKIIVLENGLKVEEGTHDALLANNGAYANIYRSQVANANF